MKNEYQSGTYENELAASRGDQVRDYDEGGTYKVCLRFWCFIICNFFVNIFTKLGVHFSIFYSINMFDILCYMEFIVGPWAYCATLLTSYVFQFSYLL
jgi:hypothetical protein